MECVRTGKAKIISTSAPQNNINLRQWVRRKINNILCILNTLSQLHRHRTISRSTTSRCIDTVYYQSTILNSQFNHIHIKTSTINYSISSAPLSQKHFQQQHSSTHL
ncbi:unnamed protein product [Schistosoma spindalis]|nr:unnamed protein product [Schistosoma spindale]CAI2733208.1 unnamed protein product [Schistosoma spindale]